MISANTTSVSAGTSLLGAFRFEGLDVALSGGPAAAAAESRASCDALLAIDLDGSAGVALGTLLADARSRLGTSGVLLLALPNRFALRFWSGCPEPGSGRLFATLAGAEASSVPAAPADVARHFVSRRELEAALESAGLAALEWFFAVPDAAGTGESGTLIAERLVTAAPELAAELAWARPSADRLRPRLDLFTEALVGRELSRAGLFGEFASHFLVAAAASEALPGATVWPRLRPPEVEVGWHCAAGRREAVTTVFELGPGGLTVGKRRARGAAAANPAEPIDQHGFLWKAPPRSPLAPGEPLRLRLQTHLVASRSEAFLDEFAALFAAVQERFQPPASALQAELAGEALDALMTNATRDASGAIHFFDLEWQAPAGIAASWWILRNVAAALDLRGRRWPQVASGAELYAKLCERLGVAPSLEADLARESGFGAAVRQAAADEHSALASALAAPWPVAVAQGLDSSALRAALDLATAHQELVASYRRLEAWAMEVQQANVAVVADYRRLAAWATELETRLRQNDPGLLP